MSMRLKTILIIILIVFATAATMFVSSLYFTNRSLEQTIEQDLEFAIGIADRLVSTKMELMKSEAVSVALRLNQASDDEQLAARMREQYDLYEDIFALAIFDRQRILHSYSEPAHTHEIDFNAEHLEMVFNGETVISSPYYCAVHGDYIMDVYTPIGDGLVLAVSMPGYTFSEMLSEQRLWQTGNVFMINEVGMFIGATDQSTVQAMNEYLLGTAEETEHDYENIAALVQTILSADKGVEQYTYEGVSSFCAYSRIESSALGWRVAVSVPMSESPQSAALRGQLYAAILFLLIGVLAAVFLSRIVSRPFKEIADKNRHLSELNETIASQSAAIMAEHERVRLMLDATPLACRLWNRDLKLIEGNQAAVELFGLSSKQEYLERYYELSPEFQSDGTLTKEKVKQIVTEAFEKGRCVHEWTYITTSGEELPCEITLVRVPYGGDYVVAGYSRDLREHKKMLAEIAHRDKLLEVSRQVSFTLLDKAETRDIESVLEESMRMLGDCVGADQAYITQNETVDRVDYFTCKAAWVADETRRGAAISAGMRFPWGLDESWDLRFRKGEVMNSPVRLLPAAIQRFFAPFNTLSVLVIPVFVEENFFGLVGFSDFSAEHAFAPDEVDILRSMSLIMAAAVHRNTQNTKIHEAERRVRLLTNATPIGFNLWDRNYHNTETNDTAVSMFGVKNQEEYLECFFRLSPEFQPDGRESKKTVMEYLDKAFETGYAQVEWLHQKADGTPLPTEVTLVRLPYGDDYVVAGYVRDLREYKQMLAEIERQEYLRTVNNLAADMLLRAEPDDFEETLKRCMGMMTQAINADRMYIEKNVTEDGKMYHALLAEWSEEGIYDCPNLSCVPWDDETAYVKEALTQGKCVNKPVSELIDADRERLSAQGVLSLLMIPIFIREEFWGFVGFNHHVVARPFTEDEVSSLWSGSILTISAMLRNEYLMNIRDTSSRLEIALTDAENANNAKSDFLAHMSHEIRTPLNAVVGLSELVMDEESLDRDSADKLEKIHDSGLLILNIVNDILDISKIEAGRFELNPIRYDTPSLINDTITLNKVRIGEKDIQFRVEIDEKLPAVLYGDDLRVKQIFNNLLSNAFKYTYSGSVTWRISFKSEGDTVWLISEIADTGIGIKPEDINRLFSSYNQVDKTTNRKVEGTGLGLVITKRLLQMMGGDIEVKSEYEKGSVFTVRFKQEAVSNTPIGTEVAANLMEMRYSLTKRNSSAKLVRVNLSYARVLAVDDIPINLDVVKGMLKPYQITVDYAISGSQAIEMIRAESPRYDAVFMDHMMPEMDGIEATRIIREEIGSEYARKIPIIALTANALVGNEDLFLANGFQAFVSKPIDILKLDFVLRQWVRDKSREKNLREKQSEQASDSLNGTAQAELIKLDGIDAYAALMRFNGDETALLDVLRSYILHSSRLLDKLEEDLLAKNLDDYAITVHGIKGSSYGIMATETGEVAGSLEKAAKENDLFTVIEKHPLLAEKLTKLSEEIGAALDAIDMAEQKPLSPKPDKAALGLLTEACRNFDMDGVDSALAALEAYRYESGGSLVVWLRDRVNAMEFETISGGEWPDPDEDEYIGPTVPAAQILLVDDNEPNLKAGMAFLKPLKAGIDLAYSGADARRMIAQKQYHLVFLDYIMPGESGLETITRIRSQRDEYHQNLPVIALTAADGEEDREKLFGAGINDFAAKPIDGEEMRAMALKWLPREIIRRHACATENAQKDAADTTTENIIIENPAAGDISEDLRTENLRIEDLRIEGINAADGVRYSGSRKLFFNLLTDFYRLIDLKSDKIRQCLLSGDFHNAAIECHALKNTARMIGAEELSGRFAALEGYEKAGDGTAMIKESESVLALFSAYKERLRPIVDVPGDKKAAEDKGVLRDCLETIIAGADTCDLDSIDAAMSELRQYQLPDEAENLIKPLTAFVAAADLEEAVVYTRKILAVIDAEDSKLSVD